MARPALLRQPVLPFASALGVALLLGGVARAQFSAAKLIAEGGSMCLDVEPADLDGDGDLDLIVCRITAPGLRWHENLGAGTFSGALTLNGSGTESAHSAHAFDFDHDGDLDIAVGVSYYQPELGVDDRFELLENMGGGLFLEAASTDESSTIQSVDVADLEGDGDLDPFYAVWSDSTVEVGKVAHGQIGGFFELVSDAIGPDEFRAADIEGDGDADFVHASSFQKQVVRYENLDGDVLYGPPQPVNPLAEGVGGVDAADLDDDADPDVLTTVGTFQNRKVQMHENLGGTYGAAQLVTAIGDVAGDVRTADFDGDSDPDVLVAENHGASWYPNDGAAHFGARQIISDSDGITTVVKAADLDGDGLLDVVLGTTGLPVRIVWHQNLSEPASAWSDLGSGLAGVAGVPELVGSGSLATGTPGSLDASSAAASAPAMVFVSLASTPTPFKGGTLLPVPVLAGIPLATTPLGALSLAWAAWPAGVSGQPIYVQLGVQDAAAVKGVALSNALKGDAP